MVTKLVAIERRMFLESDVLWITTLSVGNLFVDLHPKLTK